MLTIVDKRLKWYEDLSAGSVFEVNGSYYIKTDEHDESDRQKCVNLETGCLLSFEGTDFVKESFHFLLPSS